MNLSTRLGIAHRVRALLSRPFVRNVATVATGTAAAQVITMAFAPAITRLYGPEEIGLQGVFTSVVGLMAAISALSYPIAIVLPRHDHEAIGLIKLSLGISLVICVLATLLFSSVGEGILRVLNANAIEDYVFLVPIAMFVSTLTLLMSQWLIREKAFLVSARCTAITATIIGIAKSCLGVLQPTAASLILTNILGALVGVFLAFFGWRRYSRQRAQKERDLGINHTGNQLLVLASRYSDFPVLRTPQNLINVFSQSLPVFLLAAYFGASQAGQYSIAIAVLGIPIAVIGGSVMSVFYPRITEAVQKGENAQKLILKATAGMAASGALPFVVIMFLGPWLFGFVFGAEWARAGEYGQWLSIWLFLQYINKPSVSAIPALGLQGGLLLYEMLSTVVKVLSLWAGFVFFESDLVAVALFSSTGAILYMVLIFWVIRRSAKHANV